MANQDHQILTIIPPQKDADSDVRPQSGHGTQIKNEDGDSVYGVTSINIEILPDEVIRARFEAFINLNHQFSVSPYMSKMWAQDPTDGKVKYINKIEFDDGKVVQAGE